MAEPEPPTSSGTVDAQEHARVLKNYVDVSDQLAAANEVLSAMGRSAGDPDAVLTTVVESARRLCRSYAARLYVLEDGVYRLIKAVGASRRVGSGSSPEQPDPAGPGDAPRPGRSSTARPSRSPTCWPTRSTAGFDLQRVARVSDDHGGTDDPRPRGRRRPGCLAQRREPLRRAGDGHRVGLRRAGGDGGQRRQAGAAARGQERRAGEEGRRARGAARGGRGGQLQPRRRQCPRHHRPARRGALGDRRRVDHGVLRDGPLASWCAASTAPTPTSSNASGRSASTSTRRSVGRAARERRPIAVPDLGAVPLDPHLQILYDDGWRSLAAVPMLREGKIVGSLIVRRKRTGGFTDEAVDLLETFASQSALALAQRPALPRAEGAEPGAGAGQPAQVGVPGQHVPRAADAPERSARFLRGAARADVRRHQRATGGVPPRHPRLGPAPAGAPQRDPRPLEDRGRADGPGVLVDRRAVRCSRTPRRCCASGPPHGGRPLASTSPTTSTSCTPTCSGSSRSCST